LHRTYRLQPVVIQFGLLGLDSCESEAQLKEAYLREIKKWHPDFFQGDPVQQRVATARAKLINAAFENLSEQFEIGRFPQGAPRAAAAPTAGPQEPYRTRHTYGGSPFTTGFPDPRVFEVFVKSSCFVSAAYDSASQILYLKFVRNRVYAYLGVPESVFTDFLAAESHGKFAHRHILGRYKWMYVD
jgi:curved DNA-binding protein CbpA